MGHPEGSLEYHRENSRICIDAVDFLYSTQKKIPTEEEWLASLSPEQKAVFLTSTFNDAVHMDGFQLGYTINSRRFMSATPAALRSEGAHQCAGLAEKANAIVATEKGKGQARVSGNPGDDDFVPNEKLEELDAIFFSPDMKEDLTRPMVNVILKHPAAFGR